MSDRIPKASLASFMPLPEGSQQYPIEFIEGRGAIKLFETPDEVTVGLTNASDYLTLGAIEGFHRQRIALREIDPVELSAYLGKKLGEESSEGTNEASSDSDNYLLLDKLANDAPIVNLVNSICIEAIRSGASDIHIEAGPRETRVRYRIDGVLKTVQTFEASRFPAVSSRVKIMANLNILERRQPQDGRITVNLGKESVDLRISIIPVAGGESIVLRILGKSVAPVLLRELGFSSAQLMDIESLIAIPHGLVLVTGPTGSGKTTTLNAMIRQLVSESVKIVTIEDPVEFLVSGTNQIQINEQIGLGFDVILRRVLRHDPNVIMVGEIRDSATAEIATRAALTGHLVLSTLHTNDAVSVIPRLANMGIEPYLIASVLRGAVAQRLVRRLCPHCAAIRPATETERAVFKRYGISANTVAEPVGCDACGMTGFKGRVLIAESFITSPALEELIIEEARSADISTYLSDCGMVGISAAAARRIANHETTLKEATREVVLGGGID